MTLDVSKLRRSNSVIVLSLENISDISSTCLVLKCVTFIIGNCSQELNIYDIFLTFFVSKLFMVKFFNEAQLSNI